MFFEDREDQLINFRLAPALVGQWMKTSCIQNFVNGVQSLHMYIERPSLTINDISKQFLELSFGKKSERITIKLLSTLSNWKILFNVVFI